MSTTRILVAAIVTAVAAVSPAVASARHGGTSVRGTCSKSSTAKLKLSGDGARIETEFEVDQNRNGVRWSVTLRRNGARVTSISATTRAPSGSFTVRRLLRNGAGADKVSARGVSPSGEVCTAHATL